MKGTEMKIIHINCDTNGAFKAEENGQEAGLLLYTWEGNDTFIIEHTEVHPDFEGRNFGKQMLMAAVEYARNSGVNIIPLCPFAKSVFDKVPEIRDVLQ
jgi:predicted GNAT family acetyltransferase